jgi:hypothetical protein
VQRIGATDSVLIGAPGRALAGPVSFRLLDAAGRPVPGASVHWSVVAGNGRIAQADPVTQEDGSFHAVWELGTQASDAQKLEAELLVGSHRATSEVQALAVPIEVVSLAIQSETTEVHLGVPARLSAEATDPFGNRFTPADLRFSALDTTVVVDSMGRVAARRRGYARVVAMASGHVDTAVVHAVQVVQSIVVDRDTLRFHSIGQGQQVGITLVDDQGLAVADSFPTVTASDPAIVAVQPGESLLVQSVANGVADVQLQTGSVSRQVVAVVRQRTASLTFAASNVAFDALKDTARANLIVLDSLGVPVQSPRITYSSSDTSVVAIDTAGLLRARGNGSATVTAQSLSGVVTSVPVVVSQQVARIVVPDTLTFDALHAVLPVSAVALDRLGSPVVGATLAYVSDSGSVAAVSPSGQVEALANGMSRVVAVHGADSAAVVVRVQQRPVRVRVVSDTLRFDALGDSLAVSAMALDSLGSPVGGSMAGLQVGDTALAQVVDSTTIRARQNGVTTATFTVAGVAGAVVVDVSQVAATMTATVNSANPIVTLPQGAVLPVQCQATDRNGYSLVGADPLLAGSTGTVTGSQCSALRVQHSGFDTLRLSLGQAQVEVPVIIAVTPMTGTPLGEDVQADTLPGLTNGFWSPSARRNPAGQMEVYYTAYEPDSLHPGFTRGALHRLLWLGGTQFRYDGVALSPDGDPCSLQGQGIENNVIVPRSDSAGWRMLYAAGSNSCYGWQVFSAVSMDGRTWTKEPGIRLSNAGTDPNSMPPWPAGEGMVVDQLPTGEWRMIASTFEHVSPAENKWQITEWRSNDQLQWNYVGTVLTTRDMPAGWQGSVYSPSIRQVAPGLWRMLFTARGDGGSGSRSAIWSAVSTDRAHWQVEGEVLGAPGANLYYSAMVDDQVLTIRQDPSGMRLVMAMVTMP